MITRQPNCVVSKFYRKPLIRQYQLSFQGTASAGPNAIIHFFSLQPQCHTLIMIQVIVIQVIVMYAFNTRMKLTSTNVAHLVVLLIFYLMCVL